MVAELTGISVSTSVTNRSSRTKTLKSRIISNIVGRNACYTGSSISSSSDTLKNRQGEIIPNSENPARPRWIRNATREPIYSVLDGYEKHGSRVIGDIDSSRSCRIEKSFEYRIGALRNREYRYDDGSLPIYQENREATVGYPKNREKNNTITNRSIDEESESEVYALYSVVRKPPKLVFTGLETSKLPILEEEDGVQDEQREDKLQKQDELHKWLESALPVGEQDLEKIGTQGRSIISKQCGINDKRKELCKMISKDSPIERIDDKHEELTLESEKIESTWSSPGVSVPRGVIGMVGPFCRVYRNPNEQREYMLQEEVQERRIDVGVDDQRIDSHVKGVRGNELKNAYVEDDVNESASIVESISETGTFVHRNEEEVVKAMNKSRNSVGDDESLVVEEQQYRPRAKWRFVEEISDTVTKRINREIDDNGEETGINRALSNDQKIRDNSSCKENCDTDVPPKYTLRRSEASNEPHDKDSLNETGSITGGTVEGNHLGNPIRGERSSGPSEQAPNNDRRTISNTAPRSLVSRILARARSSDELLNHSEPYSQLWIVLSNVYGEFVIILMMALCLAEVIDTPVPLLSLQSVFLMYLYVGSIAVIISIYFWVLIDSCGSLPNRRAEDAELGRTSITRFGSLKKAHISRARTAPTSFYIRVGALLFGLATLVFNGLEMAMHSMMQGAECLSDIIFVHPVLHGFFTFLQMHFLFVNSQVLVERFGLAARFGFLHLAATNIAVWARLVIWDSAQEWTYFVHLAQRGPETSSSPLNLRGFPGSLTRRARDVLGKAASDNVMLHPYQPISPEQISGVVTLQECLNTNSLGQLWTSSMPFLYPFIVQFSLIAAAVTFVMGQNVGRNRYCHKQKFHSSKDITNHTRIGCDGSSKGLFLGILCMTAGIVVILIFLVVREDNNFSPATLSWLTCGTLIGILALSGVMTASGLVQVRQMSIVSRAPAILDALLSNVALFGVQLYAVFTAVVCACSLVTFNEETQDPESRGRHAMLLAAAILQLIQCFAQSTLIAETSKRSCITRSQMMAKPARQVITFLLFSNAVLWAFDTVVTQNWVSQELQLRFFGVLTWGIISRICLPLVVFYRFHSCVLLLEAWNKCYRAPRGEHPLN